MKYPSPFFCQVLRSSVRQPAVPLFGELCAASGEQDACMRLMICDDGPLARPEIDRETPEVWPLTAQESTSWGMLQYKELKTVFLKWINGSGHETVAVLLPGFAINW